jgi:hypothetical protein
MIEVKHVNHLCGCDPFILTHQVEQVYYMSYSCEKLSAWWVVYKVIPWERLHTPGDAGYHENQLEAGEVDEVYQDDELLCLFNINLDLTLNSLLSDANDVTVLEERKQTLSKKSTTKTDQRENRSCINPYRLTNTAVQRQRMYHDPL